LRILPDAEAVGAADPLLAAAQQRVRAGAFDTNPSSALSVHGPAAQRPSASNRGSTSLLNNSRFDGNFVARNPHPISLKEI